MVLDVLNRQAAMTLTERVLDIRRRQELKLCRASLFHYYRRRNIKFRIVMTAKSNEIDATTEVDREYFRFAYKVCTRTCKEFVLEFFRQLIRDAPVPSNQIVIVADKHAHHPARLVTEFLRQVGVTILFLPPYSSVMNP